LKDLQAVILAAVLLIPVALGAGEKDVVSPLTDEHWNAAHTLSLRNLTLLNDNESVCVVTYAPVPVWKKNKAARKLLTLIVESLKWP
jgi:hypothetical protein